MPRVFVPPFLKSLANGQPHFDVEGRSIRSVIERLEEQLPGSRDCLVQGDVLRPGLSVAIDGRVATLGLYQKVEPTTEIHFIPAIGGG